MMALSLQPFIEEKSLMDSDIKAFFWKKNLQYLGILLAIWFLVSFVFSILLVDYLDQFQFLGFKLGFWFSQQGSIFIFVILIFIYVKLMNNLDKKLLQKSKIKDLK
jgi:putative solute:sodium symporter small subunit